MWNAPLYLTFHISYIHSPEPYTRVFLYSFARRLLLHLRAEGGQTLAKRDCDGSIMQLLCTLVVLDNVMCTPHNIVLESGDDSLR